MVLRIIFVVVISTESTCTVLVRSGYLTYSFVVVEVVKVKKYNKTLHVGSLGKPVSFVFPRVLMFPSTSSRETSGLSGQQTVSLGN